MPVVLDYDADGNVVGGHTVDELPSRQYMSSNVQAQAHRPKPIDMSHHSSAMQPQAPSAQMAAVSSPQLQSSPHLLHHQKSKHVLDKSQSEQIAHAPLMPGPPQGLLRAPPTEPAASRRHDRPSFEPAGYQQTVPANSMNPERAAQQFHTHRLPQYSKYRSADHGQQSTRTAFLQHVPQQYGPIGYKTSYGPVGNRQYHQAPQYHQQAPVGRGPSNYQHLSQRFDVNQALPQSQPSQGLGSAFSSPVQAIKNATVAQIPPPQTVASPALASQPDFDVSGDISVVTEPICAKNIAHSSSNATDVPPLDISDSEAESEPLAREPSPVDDLENTGNNGSTENTTPPVPEIRFPSAADVAEPAQSLEASHIAPSPQPMGVEDGKVFVKDFSTHFAKDLNALATFETLCKNFNRGTLNEVEFVTAMFRLLHRNKATHLMTGFVDFLPATWKDADMSWLSRAVAHDMEKKQKPALQQVDVTAQTAGKPKKKRPINAFSTADGPDAPSRKSLIVKLPLPGKNKAQALLTPPLSATELVHMPALPAAVVAANKGQNAKPAKAKEDAQPAVKLPVKHGKNDRTTAAKRKAPLGRRKSTTSLPPSSKYGTGKFPVEKGQTTKTDGTIVEHVGPLFINRRAVIARASKPYIHAFCGLRFSHPGDVKSHHRKAKNCVNAAGESKGPEVEWDAHPSCKVDYPQINYTKVANGYVILDQPSWDKLEGAIQAGLQEVGPFRRYDDPGSEPEEEEESESDAEGKKRSVRIASAKAKSKAEKSRKRAASATTATSPPASKKVSLATDAEDVGSDADADGDTDSEA